MQDECTMWCHQRLDSLTSDHSHLTITVLSFSLCSPDWFQSKCFHLAKDSWFLLLVLKLAVTIPGWYHALTHSETHTPVQERERSWGSVSGWGQRRWWRRPSAGWWAAESSAGRSAWLPAAAPSHLPSCTWSTHKHSHMNW